MFATASAYTGGLLASESHGTGRRSIWSKRQTRPLSYSWSRSNWI